MRPFSKRSVALWLALCVTSSAVLADNSKISPDLQTGGLVGGLAGGVLNAVFSLIPAVSATVHPASLIAISNQSNVAYISLDRPLSASLDYSAGAVNAPQAWSSGWDGTSTQGEK